MIQMLFFLRFQSQLRRSRPHQLRQLDQTIRHWVTSSGGQIDRNAGVLKAEFDETLIAFWLDLATTLEHIQEALGAAEKELFGYACVVRSSQEKNEASLVRSLARLPHPGGIWCDTPVRKALERYVVFDAPPDDFPAYQRILKNRDEDSGTNTGSSPSFPSPRDTLFIDRLFENSLPGILLRSPSWATTGPVLWPSLREYLNKTETYFFPLIVRFGVGGNNAACLADSVCGALDILALDEPTRKELEELCKTLSADRLRDGATEKTKGDLQNLLVKAWGAYGEAARRTSKSPILILENPEDAQKPVLALAAELSLVLLRQPKARIVVITQAEAGAVETLLEGWTGRDILFCSNDEAWVSPPVPKIDLTQDLWEVAYIFHTAAAYFPLYEIPELFTEEGKSRAIVQRAVQLLEKRGVIIDGEDIRFRFPQWDQEAEAVLGDRCSLLRALIRRRLLDRVTDGRLQPSFGLVRALAALGGDISEDLVLDSVMQDTLRGTVDGIEKSLGDQTFSTLVGFSRSEMLEYLYRTLRALQHGSPMEMDQAFSQSLPEGSWSPRSNAVIVANQAAYFLGRGEIKKAEDQLKRALLLVQQPGVGRGIARIYRLFGIVHLALRRISDGMDYFSFAQESKDKNDDAEEASLTLYYSAVAYYLFGNVGKAIRYTIQAREAALRVGQRAWADWCLFFQGRLLFETGRYDQAQEILRTIETPVPLAKKLVQAWLYRCDLYRNPSKSLAPPPEGGDGDIFRLERDFFAKNYGAVIAWADHLLTAESTKELVNLEQPDWTSAFSQCEALVFPQASYQKRLILFYRALALSYSSKAPSPSTDEAVETLRSMVKDEYLPECDPLDPVYSFGYYRVLKNSAIAEIDVNTALSIAFKRLQKRAARIDDRESRDSYVNLHYWNGALGVEAKKHNLI